MSTKLLRLARMDGRELAWRSRVAAGIVVDRARAAVRPSAWNRARLLAALARTADLEPARVALAAGQWGAAHEAIEQTIAVSRRRFPIAPSIRCDVAERIRTAFPNCTDAAKARADMIVAGHFDLLGYTGLRFGEGASIDWHLDPVHGRKPPREFWADVPFLSPESGDHKIIWELNRQQHWLALGRAFWLTGDDLYRNAALAQLESWLAANPPLIGVNWSSMLELAFRSISWVWALNFFGGTTSTSGPWTVDLLLGLDRQLLHVERHLSYYFSPNTHLLGEALALYVSGIAVPQLSAAPRRAALGRQILLDEISRQIGSDGGHCERSTHYHRYALDFYLLALVVARLDADPAAAAFEEAVARLATAARALADDRGRLPHLGDDDGGAGFPMAGRALDDIADSLEAASALVEQPALRIGEPTEEAMWLLADPMFAPALDAIRRAPVPVAPRSLHLSDTGYCISRSEGGTHLVVDAGPHGYQNAGHAHADALSMTLAVRSVPLLIDPGTHCYTINNSLRDRMRSTALHNTLTLDERQASVPAGPFSWARAADGDVHRWRANRNFDYIDASHDGYAPLEHRRRVLALHDDLVVVADFVRGDGLRRADVHWHLDPQWAIALRGRSATATADGGEVEMFFPAGEVEQFVAAPDTGLGWHAPVYGRLEPCTTLRVTRIGHAPLWIVSVFGLRADNPIESADIVPVWVSPGVLDHSLALKITRALTIEHVLFAERRGALAKEVGTSGEPSWRVGDIETNAAMLFCRAARGEGERCSAVGIVDGSRVRKAGRSPFAFERPSIADDWYLDLAARSCGATDDQRRPHVRDCGIR